jgi:hypothetical protein
MKRQNGVYERRDAGMKPVVHAILVKDNKVADAWVYQSLGQYIEPGFAATVVGKDIADIDMTGYKRVQISPEDGELTGCDCGWSGKGTGPGGRFVGGDRCPVCGESLF